MTAKKFTLTNLECIRYEIEAQKRLVDVAEENLHLTVEQLKRNLDSNDPYRTSAGLMQGAALNMMEYGRERDAAFAKLEVLQKLLSDLEDQQ